MIISLVYLIVDVCVCDNFEIWINFEVVSFLIDKGWVLGVIFVIGEDIEVDEVVVFVGILWLLFLLMWFGIGLRDYFLNYGIDVYFDFFVGEIMSDYIGFVIFYWYEGECGGFVGLV